MSETFQHYNHIDLKLQSKQKKKTDFMSNPAAKFAIPLLMPTPAYTAKQAKNGSRTSQKERLKKIVIVYEIKWVNIGKAFQRCRELCN